MHSCASEVFCSLFCSSDTSIIVTSVAVVFRKPTSARLHSQPQIAYPCNQVSNHLMYLFAAEWIMMPVGPRMTGFSKFTQWRICPGLIKLALLSGHCFFLLCGMGRLPRVVACVFVLPHYTYKLGYIIRGVRFNKG